MSVERTSPPENFAQRKIKEYEDQGISKTSHRTLEKLIAQYDAEAKTEQGKQRDQLVAAQQQKIATGVPATTAAPLSQAGKREAKEVTEEVTREGKLLKEKVLTELDPLTSKQVLHKIPKTVSTD